MSPAAKKKRKKVAKPKEKPFDPKIYDHEYNAWLSPRGKLIPCQYGNHRDVAECLEGAEPPDYSLSLEKKGWVKLAKGQWYWYYQNPRFPNPRQKKIIAAWCTDHGEKMPHCFMED